MKKHLDIIIVTVAVLPMTCLIIGTTSGHGDCGNAKVVRGKDTIALNQDSITSAYYYAKSDSIMKAVRAKSERKTSDE